MNTPIFKYLGDTEKAISRKAYGIDLLNKMREFMSFQGLHIHQDRRIFSDGCGGKYHSQACHDGGIRVLPEGGR